MQKRERSELLSTGVPIEARCPMLRFIDVIAGKWAIPTLYRLIVSERELQRALIPVTQKELTRQLKTFEQYGLVTRQVFTEVPPRVEYQITPFGLTLNEPLSALARWMEQHGEKLMEPTSSDRPGLDTVAPRLFKQ